MKPLTYLVSDEEPLENLHKQLNIILDELNRSTTTNFGLVMNKEKNENKRSSHSYEKLPIPKRKKSSLTRRVGATNEACKRIQVINVKSETFKKNGLIEEIVNMNENMHYDIPMSEKEPPTEKSSEISDAKKLTCMYNNQLINNSLEKTNNGEDNSINIEKSLNLKISCKNMMYCRF